MKFEFTESPEESPINFKYEVLSNTGNVIMFEVSVFDNQEFIKKMKNEATFESKDKITIKNSDDSSVKSNTYSRVQPE